MCNGRRLTDVVVVPHHYRVHSSRDAAGAYKKVQGLLKSVDLGEKADAASPGVANAETRSSPSSVVVRVAQLLALIGRREAASILKRMPKEQADRVLDAMAHLGPIPVEEARRVLGEFGAAGREAVRASVAGPETAREILVRAFGQEDGDRRFYQILPEERPRRFAFLEDADGRQLAVLLRDESAATLTIVCAHMPEAAAARLLDALPRELKSDIVRRMARLDEVDGAVLDAVAQTLRRRMEDIERPDGEEIDGRGRLAEILRHMDLTSSEHIIGGLERDDHDLAEHIRRQLTGPDDICYIDDRDLQRVLQKVDDVDIAVFLKGKSDDVTRKIGRNLSDRRRQLIDMHRESLGPMHRRDVDRVTGDFMELLRTMARDGEIVLRLPGEEYI